MTTSTIAIPAPNMPTLALPYYSSKVSAGFPSPSHEDASNLDLNEYLIKNKIATFFVRVQGHSMQEAGIQDGDLLIVDRSLEAQHGHIVIAVVDGQMTVKRLEKKHGRYCLKAAHPDYPDIHEQDVADAQVWGRVMHVIHSFKN